MESYEDSSVFENDSSNMNFDFLHFDDEENLQDMSSITQVCVDNGSDELTGNGDMDTSDVDRSVDSNTMEQSTSGISGTDRSGTNKSDSSSFSLKMKSDPGASTHDGQVYFGDIYMITCNQILSRVAYNQECSL